METRQRVKAEQFYRRAHTLSPGLPFPNYGPGPLQAGQAHHAGAVVSFRKAIPLGGSNPQTCIQLVVSLFALGEKPATAEALQKALRLDPRYPGAERALRENRLPGEQFIHFLIFKLDVKYPGRLLTASWQGNLP